MATPNFEKTIEFILEHQAKFAVDLQKLQESQARLEESQARLVQSHAQIVQAQERTDATLRGLIDVSMSLANHLEAIDERLNRFIVVSTEAQEHTNRRLDALIDVVDRLVRRNGGQPSGAGAE